MLTVGTSLLLRSVFVWSVRYHDRRLSVVIWELEFQGLSVAVLGFMIMVGATRIQYLW